MYSVKELKDQFVRRYKDYENDVNNFFDYLISKYDVSIDSTNITLIMQGIDTEEIRNSLEYLVEIGKYKKEETAKKYANAIGRFFEFIKENSSLRNQDLFDALEKNSRKDDSYIARMMLYIERCSKLEAKETFDIMEESKVEELLDWCDEQLNEVLRWEEERGYKKANAALCIKLMLIYGITYRVARNIRLYQIDLDNNEIELGGFRLRLPVHLGRQMSRFIIYKNENLAKNNEDYLFTDRKGKPWSENTSSSSIPNFLKTRFGSTDLTGIIKYGIKQLLMTGLNDHVVKKITGASNDLISGCITNSDKDWYREINNKIVTVQLYYRF